MIDAKHVPGLALLVLVGCPGPDVLPDAPRDLTTVAVIPALNRALDVLFVIDNSASMGERQGLLADGFPRFLDVLRQVEGGLPDVHLGIVSTNVGTGGVPIPGCSFASRPEGDDGNLLTNTCSDLAGSFISDIKQPDGTRSTNYSGDLAALFSCMARLGITGCGFEQPLESMRRALEPGKNPGFLRADARLAVVIFSDEDDCSALPGGALFGDPNADINSPLGPRTSFRCFEFGVACAGDTNPRAYGPRTGCEPRTDSPYMPPVVSYVEFLRALKPNPRDLIVSGFVGDIDEAHAANVVPDLDDPALPALGTSCTSLAGDGVPAFRLHAFLGGVPAHTTATICGGDFTDAIGTIAGQIRDAIGDPCLDEILVDTDPGTAGVQPRCSVTEYVEVDGAPSNPIPVPRCDGTTTPCWRLSPQPERCAASPGQLGFELDRGGGHAVPGTVVEFRCEVAP